MNLREIIEKLPYYEFDVHGLEENIPRYVVMFYILLFGEKAGYWNVMSTDGIRYMQECLYEMQEDAFEGCYDLVPEFFYMVDDMLAVFFDQRFNGRGYYSSMDMDEMDKDDIIAISELADSLGDQFPKKEYLLFVKEVCNLVTGMSLLHYKIWIFELDPLFGRYLTYPEEFELSEGETVNINKVMSDLLHCEKNEISIFFDNYFEQQFIYTGERAWYMVLLGETEIEDIELASFNFELYSKYLEICDILRICHRKKVA